MFRQYKHLLEKQPLATKSITSGFLFAFGDGISQVLFDRASQKEKWTFDSRRCLNMFIVGNFFAGPALHKWYTHILPRLVNAQPNPTKAQYVFNTAKGIVLDQTIFSSFFLINFFTLNNLMSGKSIQESMDNLKELFVPTLLTNWKIWPILQIFNQTINPIQYRVLFVNFCGLFWNIYLSNLAYSEQQMEEASQKTA